MKRTLAIMLVAGLTIPALAQKQASAPTAARTAALATTEAVPIQQELLTLRNFDPAEEQTIWFAERATPIDSGFVFGTNIYGDKAKATAFALPPELTEAQLMAINVWFGFKNQSVTNEQYSLEVYEGTPASGPTGSPLYSASLALINVNADDDTETPSEPTVHTIDLPVPVGSTFFVSVDFGSYGPGGVLNATIVATDIINQRVPEVWEQWSDDSWHNVSEAWFQSGNAGWHLWIEAVVETGIDTAADDADEVPETVTLWPSYPNPFNPATALRFGLPAPSDVELTVVDMLGRRVATLAQGLHAAGTHTVRFEAGDLPSGLYLARLRVGTVTRTQKMVLLR